MNGFLLALFFAVIVGSFGNRLMRNGMPGGSFVSMLAGLVGAWVGGYMPVFSTFGPSVDSLAIVPSLLGAVLFVFFLGLSGSVVKQAK